MSPMKLAIFALLFPLAAAACGGGTMHFPGGAPACFAHCASANMEMDSFVYMGDFSSACVCRIKTDQGAAPARGAAAGAASGASAALVVMQQQQHAAGAAAARR